jgi:hypothetical protein
MTSTPDNDFPKTTPAHPCQVNPMGYIAWHAKAARLTRQKVRQTLCPICDRLKFPDEECAERMAQRASA